MKQCGKCKKENDSKSSGYCLACKAEWMRNYRKTHPMTKDQRMKDNARSYTAIYVRRGKIKKEVCGSCGDRNSQIHHLDYSKPLLIEWLCRECHMQKHKQELKKAG